MNRDLKQALFLVGGGLAAFYVIKQLLGSGAAAVAGAFNDAGQWVGESLYDFVHPTTPGSWTYYRTLFPDGSIHMIGDAEVGAGGSFMRDNAQYQMRTTASGGHVALLVD